MRGCLCRPQAVCLFAALPPNNACPTLRCVSKLGPQADLCHGGVLGVLVPPYALELNGAADLWWWWWGVSRLGHTATYERDEKVQTGQAGGSSVAV